MIYTFREVREYSSLNDAVDNIFIKCNEYFLKYKDKLNYLVGSGFGIVVSSLYSGSIHDIVKTTLSKLFPSLSDMTFRFISSDVVSIFICLLIVLITYSYIRIRFTIKYNDLKMLNTSISLQRQLIRNASIELESLLSSMLLSKRCTSEELVSRLKNFKEVWYEDNLREIERMDKFIQTDETKIKLTSSLIELNNFVDSEIDRLRKLVYS